MIAVIDIGSNSVRMLIQSPHNKQKYTKITKLSEGLSITGILKKAAIRRTVNAVKEFCNIAVAQSARHMFLFATEAVRAASNGNEFIYNLKLKTGLTVDVISGELEAKIGYIGASGKGLSGIIDIGGASTEVTIGEGAVIKYTKSCKIGTVRLTDLSGQNESAMKKYLEEHCIYQNEFGCSTFRAIGGTASTLAAMDLCLKKFSGAAIDGHTLTLKTIINLKDKIFSLPPKKRKLPGLHPSRRYVISAGVMILIEVMSALKVAEVIVTDSDNLEGYIKYKYGLDNSFTI